MSKDDWMAAPKVDLTGPQRAVVMDDHLVDWKGSKLAAWLVGCLVDRMADLWAHCLVARWDPQQAVHWAC